MVFILQLNSVLTTIKNPDLLMNEAQSHGFVLAMAATPHPLPPEAWINELWGNMDPSPFQSPEQLETYIHCLVELWNELKANLLAGTWQWPEGFSLDDQEIVTQSVRDFCEGVLQGWQLTHDDWQELMPPSTEEGGLLGGVLLSVSMLYDPDTATESLQQHGAVELSQFEEIYHAMPMMLCRLAQLGHSLAEQD